MQWLGALYDDALRSEVGIKTNFMRLASWGATGETFTKSKKKIFRLMPVKSLGAKPNPCKSQAWFSVYKVLNSDMTFYMIIVRQ